MADIPSLLTVKQFAERHPAFPESSLRWLRYRHGDMAGAFLNVGRRILVDEERFFAVVRDQGRPAGAGAPGG